MHTLIKSSVTILLLGGLILTANAAWEGDAEISNIFVGDYFCTNGEIVLFQFQGNTKYYCFYVKTTTQKGWLSQLLMAKSGGLKVKVMPTGGKCGNDKYFIEKMWIYE